MQLTDASVRQTNAQRALATYAAMQKYLYAADGTSLYRETYPGLGGSRPYAFLWPFSRALIGTLSLAGVPPSRRGGLDIAGAVADRLVGLAKYRDTSRSGGAGRGLANRWAKPAAVGLAKLWAKPGAVGLAAYDSYVRPPLGEGGDRYLDDNAWVALALVEQYRLGVLASLELPRLIFELGRAAWDRSAADPHPGGIFWVEQDVGQGRTNHDRGAGLTAGYARLGFHLRELTGSSEYTGDGTLGPAPGALGALNMVNWVDTVLDSTGSGPGLYWNAIRPDGSIDTNLWTYVQGQMIGARVLQYRLTRDGRCLEQAEDVARTTLATFGTFVGQPPSFNVMCFQALLLLSTLTHDADLVTRIGCCLQGYADWAWDPATGAHDQTTGLFHFAGDSGAPGRDAGHAAQLQDQGALVQLYALLAWNPADYARLA